MTSNRTGTDRSKSSKVGAPQSIPETGSFATLIVAHSGEWLAVEEFQEKALAAVREGSHVALDLAGVDHLDASAFQILLALGAEQKKQGKELRLQNASAGLSQWFDHAGASQLISGSEAAGRNV